ncbi:C4-dicarboxylate transporter DcuC [Sutterella sp.]|uniref:C4-dicarboxylate transporter DcuC n=1 Tax=Sutterella sp. TaxID=1981025 RepID=UPI0026DEE072|nr:C4-dicarboxylate transporter DcuC [Sutterella sp.]MDO5532385.1 C4-dicarboxylate transporter DcuC [Sutterella sp.]
MPVTGWIAILVVIGMIYLLVKRWETRLVLFGAGFILCCISLDPMAGLNAFAKTMTNASLIMAICAATGFAYCITYTECDRSLVYYLSRPIRNIGLLLVPITAIITFLINIAIPSAVGVGAVVGTTFIPLMIRAGIKPVAAAAAVLMGTTGSLLSPGLSHNAYVSEMAGMTIVDLISYHAVYSAMIGIVGAVGLAIVTFVLGDHKGDASAVTGAAGKDEKPFKPSAIRAIIPVVPIVLLLVFTFWIPSVKMGVAQAMLIGTILCVLVCLPDLQKYSNQFFKGMGDSYGSIMGIIIAAGVLAAGLKVSGLVDGLISIMVQSNEIAQWGGSFGPFILSVVMGSGDAGALAFNGAVTPHAQEFGMEIHKLGSLAFLAGAAGRTASPIAGITILVAGIAQVNPFDVAKRTAVPMLVACFLLAIFMR